jgi:hypothetical protein
MSQAQYGQQQQYDQQAQYGQQQQAQYDQQQPYIQPAQAPNAPYEYQADNGAIMVYDPSNGMSYTPEQYQQMLQPQPQYQQQQQPQHAMPQNQNQWGEPQQPVFGQPQQQQQQFQGTNPAAYGLSQPQQQQQQQTPKAPAPAPSRIDPKQIPRPSYSISEPVKFFTRAGACPPPANSNFVAIDEGNASPRFMRLTCNHIPSTPELVDASRIAVGAVIQVCARAVRVCGQRGEAVQSWQIVVNRAFRFHPRKIDTNFGSSISDPIMSIFDIPLLGTD